MKICKRTLFIGLCLGVSAALLIKSFLFKASEGYLRRGPFMDQACVDFDCSTEEGKKSAVEMCNKAFEKSAGYKFLKSACSNPDPEISRYSCPENCDPADVSAFVEYKGKATLPACVNDPVHPDKSVDGTMYCWSNKGTYIVKPKNTPSGTAIVANPVIATSSGITASSASAPPVAGVTSVASSPSTAPATGITATSARLRYY